MRIGSKVIGMLMDIDVVHDYCDDYGEPGYTKEKEDGFIIFGDIWCDGNRRGKRERCKIEDRWSKEGGSKLHSIDAHYPRLFAAMEEQGIEFQWYDEWIIDHEGGMGGKAYRTQADSYMWQSSILWTDGDFLTPDHDIEEWVEYVVNNPRVCLPSHVWSDEQLNELGFEEYQCGYENGWFPGQTDNPEEISKIIGAEYAEQGKGVDILFKLSYVSQFDLGFCVFVREVKEEEEDD